MTLGNLIRNYRTARGLSLDEVAAIVGASKSNLSRIECDMLEPGIGLCVRLSVLLGVSVQRMAAAAVGDGQCPPPNEKPPTALEKRHDRHVDRTYIHACGVGHLPTVRTVDMVVSEHSTST